LWGENAFSKFFSKKLQSLKEFILNETWVKEAESKTHEKHQSLTAYSKHGKTDRKMVDSDTTNLKIKQ
jgi:hypothetical protein